MTYLIGDVKYKIKQKKLKDILKMEEVLLSLMITQDMGLKIF